MFSANDITLYVPCYNADATLHMVVDAIYGQSVTPADILLVDDGSSMPVTLSSVRVIRHESNRGLAATRNTALNACTTSLIASLDADVVPDEKWLENLLTCMNQGGYTGVGGCLDERFQDTPGDRWRAVHMAQHWGEQCVENPRFLFGSNTLFFTEAVRAAGAYDEIYRTNNEDRTLCDRLYKQGLSLCYEPQAHCEHLRRDTCASVLKGFWQWHHAAGLERGDYDSIDGLMRRISDVAFGIFDYRFFNDKHAGNEELLVLDAAIPWVFCCLDLMLYTHRHNLPSCARRMANLQNEMSSNAWNNLLLLLPMSENDIATEPEWMGDYLGTFTEMLHTSQWHARCMALLEAADQRVLNA